MLIKSNTQHAHFLVKYPLVAFFILAVVLGTSTVYLVVQGILPANVALASALSASIAGIILTALTDGRTGLIEIVKPIAGGMHWHPEQCHE